MDKPTSQNSPARARIRNDLLRVYFCRKLLNEGLLTAEQLYPAENNVEHERRVETPSSEFASSPLAVNGTVTPNLEPSNVNRLFNRQPDQLTLQLEHTVIAPRSWNCGVYSPIEVLIDSPSAIDNSGQTSTMLSSIAPSEDMSTESDLFEMDVLERINRLRRQGKWSLTRLPLCLDAPRPKTHHDYFLEECMMMQIDFVHERATKKMAAKMLAYEAKHYVQQKNSGVINLCTTSNQTSKRTRKRAGDSINDLISNLPADYVGDLKSRVVSSNLFNDLQTTDVDRWKLVEDVCAKVSSVRPEDLLKLTNFNSNIRNFCGTLRSYQLVALKWLLNSFDNSFGCILTDEKGLGKKVQILAFLAFLEDCRRVTGPHLIVTDEKANWSIALERFLPHANVLEFTDQKEDMLHSFNICLVDHETFRSETFTNSFGNCAFQVQVVDKVDQMEFLEENDSKESFLHGDYRFRVFIGNLKFLEQTFEKKRLSTILLKFLLPKQFQNAFESGLNDEELAKVDDKQLVSFLQAFHLSRTKEQIADQIPSENLEVCKCRMTSKQQKFYNKLIELPEVKQGLNSDKALQVMDLLRKCCSHPFLVQEEQMQEKTPFNFSLFYPILRQCFLDNDQSEFCEQLKFEESFRTRLQRLQTSSLDIAEKPTQSLVCCSPPATDKLNLNLQSAISTYPFQFVGPNTSSLSTVWQRNQSNQLANEMFKKRSPQDDTELTNSCVHLPDKSLILPHSGKLQEVFKKLAEVRKQKKRCIIFTSYQSTQQLLCEALAHHSFAYMLLSENANRKEFLGAFNKNQRIACVVASTRDSLYRLNLNNIGAVFVLETDWEFEHNDNIKRFFVKSYQCAGAKFYNFITEDSIEVRTNLLDTDVKPLLSEISRSIVNSTTTEQNGTIETNDQDADKDVVPEITTIFAPICHDADGVESISDTLSSSGYEGSLDENASLHAEPLVYDKNFLESDSYLASVFGLQWRHHANNDKFGFVEEAQVFDSFSNSWYTGDVIEPDEIEYTKMTPSEHPLDEDTLFDFGEDQENYIDSGAVSPKSTDDFMDLSTPPTSVEASRISTEFSLDPAIQMQGSRAEQDQETRMALKRSQRMQSRSDELRRKLLETQSIVLPDPDPLFRLDGKPGYTPSKKGTEWHDADTPSWTYIEDHALLALALKQMCAIPIPNYISRSFCMNWELIAFELDKSSFHKRSPNQCCNRFRELIAKKFAPVENPSGLVEQFEEIDLSALKDEQISSSSQQTTKFFNRSIAALARKLEDLKRIRNTWQARSNWLNSCDDGERFDVLNRLGTSEKTTSAFESSRLKRLLNCPNTSPSKILTANKKGLPLDIVMVYHQYSRGLRLSRVITAAKSSMIKAMKKPVEYQQITAYSQSITNVDQKMFIKSNDTWELHAFNSPTSFNYQPVKAPKIQAPLENRMFWIDREMLSQMNNNIETKIFNLLQFNFMQFTVDIRSNMLSSKKPISEILQITSNFVLPKMPKRPKRIVKLKTPPNKSTDEDLLEDVQYTLQLKEPFNVGHKVMSNGVSLLPIPLQYFVQNDGHFYPPILAKAPATSTLTFDQSAFELLSQLNSMPQEEKEDAISIANLFEELLLEYQDHTMFSSDVNDCIRFDENTTQQLFSTAVKSDLILKIQKRRINKKSSTKRARYVIVCVPGDHFELHKIDVDTETQQLCIHDKHTQKLLDSSIRINDIDKRQMKKLISQLESSDNNRPSSKLSVESSQIIFNSAVCSLHSNRLQYERIQQNADESKSVSISNFIPQQNNYSDKFGSFAYIIRPTIKIEEIPPVKRKQHRIQIEDLPDEDQLPVVTRIDDQSKDSMQLLISEEGTSTSNEELEDVDEFDIEIDESFQLNDKQSSAMIYFEGSEEESEENESEETAKIDQTAVEEMLKLLQSDESSINVESLLAINQFFELSQPTIGYSKQSTDQFKLPQTTVFEMDEVERFISGRFDCKPSTAKSSRVYVNSSTTNPLEILINEQYKTVLAELQHLQNNKIPAGLANNDNDELTYPVALKLQLNTKAPNFMQVLPTDSVKFNVKYVPKKRLLTLQYQTIVQQDCLAATCSDGSKLSFNVECKPSAESSSTTPTKSSASPSTTCLMLKKPAIRAEILKHFVKMSDSERSQWLLAIKHRFLRQKHFQQKRRIFRSIDKMHKVADEVLKENKEELSSDKNKTDAEIKKAAIQRLLASKDTKYPVDELKTKSKTKKSTSSTKQKSSLHLADLLLQSTSRCRMNLGKKMHPTFAKIDSTKMKEKWSDKTEAIKVQYKVGKKSLIAFDHSLENFYKKLNHELPSKLFEAKPIETSEDIHDRLLFRTNAGPSKIIKYKVPTEVPTSTRPEKKTEQQTPVAVAEQPPASLPDLNLDQFVSAETPPYADEQNSSTQQTDSSRERQISSIQIPSAMQVPASAVYHLQSDPQATSASQTVQNADPVYYTKRSLNTFSPASSGTNVVQRIAPIQTQSFEPTRVSSISALNVPKQRQLAPRPMVRHVVIGNRPKMSGDTDSMERQFVQQREESGYESRYYQTAIGQRELTVREKLQQDMARGVVQSGQKKHYPVRVPTTMKRKISESQHQFGDESPNAIDPKRSRPAQYMYQVKGPSTILSSQAAKPQQTSMSGNISNLSEQQSTSQTVPMIFHHGEPIKTYIRRENHQFSIHDPASYHSTPSGSPAQYSKSPQLKVYEKRSTPSEPPSTVQRKSADTEPEASSSSV